MRAARLRLVAQTLALPAVVLVLAVTWALWVLPELPDPVATRFGDDQAATDFTPPGTFITVVALTTAFTAGVFGVLLLSGVSSGRAGRVLAGAGAGAATLVPVMMATTLHPQVGLDDASAFHLPWPAFVAPFVIAVVAGTAVGLLVRPVGEPEESIAAGTPIAVGDTSLAAWFGKCRAPWIMSVLLVVAVGATAVTSIAAFRQGDAVLGSVYILLAIAVGIAMSMLLGVRVRVDAMGVHWRLLPGLPRRTIRYPSIRDVAAVDVKPGDWGGWGYRFGGKGTAILIRGGEGLRIERTNGRALYVTVDDAARGAELARAHLRRYRS
ncbi:hypothetical protein ACFWGD_01265 [Corynebacterium sp. NPDC060344]|uniref:hypothetical protein n=1 Tax=Corynebacterium sp. NPDC060344 TaxID=3347101 RepID=UPI00365BBF47